MNVLILIGGHLCTAPRPFKEATALAMAGVDVQVRGVRLDAALAERDQQLLKSFVQPKHGSLTFAYHAVGGRLPQIWSRVRRGLARRAPGLHLPERFGLCPREMLRAGRELRPDLVIAHSEAALWAAARLADEGIRVGIDIEDWFSQDLLPEARAHRPVAELDLLEGDLLRRGRYRLTTSNVLATTLAHHHRVAAPAVVRNVFPRGTEPDLTVHAPVRLHWFSQTIGPGRGLELLFAALPEVTEPVEIHLRGALYPRYRDWLTGQIPAPWRDRVHVHPTVSNAELHEAIAQHDIGLALESRAIRNRDLSITNKLFQYLAGGLAVIATSTEGQREALGEAPGAGVLIDEDAADLARAINTMAGDPVSLRERKDAARTAARERLCWEVEAPRLLAEYERATSN